MSNQNFIDKGQVKRYRDFPRGRRYIATASTNLEETTNCIMSSGLQNLLKAYFIDIENNTIYFSFVKQIQSTSFFTKYEKFFKNLQPWTCRTALNTFRKENPNFMYIECLKGVNENKGNVRLFERPHRSYIQQSSQRKCIKEIFELKQNELPDDDQMSEKTQILPEILEQPQESGMFASKPKAFPDVETDSSQRFLHFFTKLIVRGETVESLLLEALDDGDEKAYLSLIFSRETLMKVEKVTKQLKKRQTDEDEFVCAKKFKTK